MKKAYEGEKEREGKNKHENHGRTKKDKAFYVILSEESEDISELMKNYGQTCML